jgi:hypothetical protein
MNLILTILEVILGIYEHWYDILFYFTAFNAKSQTLRVRPLMVMHALLGRIFGDLRFPNSLACIHLDKYSKKKAIETSIPLLLLTLISIPKRKPLKPQFPCLYEP